MSRNKTYLQLVSLALAVASFSTVVLPLQTFLANREMFQFGMADVVTATLPLTAMVFLILLPSVALLNRFLAGLGSVLAVILLAYLYFETGFFSTGLPPLDGAIVAFQNPFRSIIDLTLIIIVALAFLCCWRWVRRWAHWIACAILILGCASLLDVRPHECANARLDLADGFAPHVDVLKSIRFSPSRNVIMLILDSTPASLTSAVLNRRPDLCARLKGFVAYEQNLAMSEMTQRGLPGLMTGVQLSPDVSCQEYIDSMYGEKSLLLPYVRAKAPVYFSGGVGRAYTNRRLCDSLGEKSTLVSEGPVFTQNSTSVPYLTLADVLCFRMVPYCYKVHVLKSAFERIGKSRKHSGLASVGEEDILYPELLQHPISTETNVALVIVHTTGIHGPITRDKFGHSRAPTQDVAAHYEYGEYLLGNVADFMDGLQRNGVYDNSTIIICADHGLIILREGDGTKGHGAESSILWVKPAKAESDFIFSRIPTSNIKIAPLVRKLLTRDIKQDEIDSTLTTSNRTFIAKFGSKWWTFGRMLTFYEWCYDDEGHVISCKDKGIYQAN